MNKSHCPNCIKKDKKILVEPKFYAVSVPQEIIKKYGYSETMYYQCPECGKRYERGHVTGNLYEI